MYRVLALFGWIICILGTLLIVSVAFVPDDRIRNFTPGVLMVGGGLALLAIVDQHKRLREVHNQLAALSLTHAQLKDIAARQSHSLQELRAEMEQRSRALESPPYANGPASGTVTQPDFPPAGEEQPPGEEVP